MVDNFFSKENAFFISSGVWVQFDEYIAVCYLPLTTSLKPCLNGFFDEPATETHKYGSLLPNLKSPWYCKCMKRKETYSHIKASLTWLMHLLCELQVILSWKYKSKYFRGLPIMISTWTPHKIASIWGRFVCCCTQMKNKIVFFLFIWFLWAGCHICSQILPYASVKRPGCKICCMCGPIWTSLYTKLEQHLGQEHLSQARPKCLLISL